MARAEKNTSAKADTKRDAVVETNSTSDDSIEINGQRMDRKGAHRSSDNQSLPVETSVNTVETAEPNGNIYQKVFVVSVKSGWSGTEEQDKANKLGVLSQAAMNGSFPIADPVFVKEEMQEDGISLNLYYEVKVKPVEEGVASHEILSPSHSDFTAEPK